MQIIAEASGVRKSYRLGETICGTSGVDLKVEKGEFWLSPALPARVKPRS